MRLLIAKTKKTNPYCHGDAGATKFAMACKYLVLLLNKIGPCADKYVVQLYSDRYQQRIGDEGTEWMLAHDQLKLNKYVLVSALDKAKSLTRTFKILQNVDIKFDLNRVVNIGACVNIIHEVARQLPKLGSMDLGVTRNLEHLLMSLTHSLKSNSRTYQDTTPGVPVRVARSVDFDNTDNQIMDVMTSLNQSLDVVIDALKVHSVKTNILPIPQFKVIVKALEVLGLVIEQVRPHTRADVSYDGVDLNDIVDNVHLLLDSADAYVDINAVCMYNNVSADAMVCVEEFEDIKKLNTLEKFSENMVNPYPSITTAAHAAMVWMELVNQAEELK